MRPHLLRMSAFGPFAGSVEIDFDRLAEGGLFLMHGATGAGKTSVLDALSFALYGRVAGVRGVQRLRSDHAEPQIRTEVQLEVSIGGRRLRIVRTPAQQRPKLRGSGTTTEPASVALDEWDEGSPGGWRRRSSRVGEVDGELSELLGMSADQFHQVVLLPQGEFARFLHSDAGERTQLLQRLFGTDRFRRIEDWLAEQRRQTREAWEQRRQRAWRVVARIAQAGDTAEPADLPDIEWADELVAEAREAAEAARLQAAAAHEAHAAARRLSDAALDLDRRQRRRAEALQQREVLMAGEALIAEAVAEIEVAQRAAVVRPMLDAQQARQRQHAQACAAGEQAVAQLPEELRSATGAQLSRAAAESHEALGRLVEAEEVEQAAIASAREASGAVEAAQQAQQQLAELAQQQSQAPQARAAAQQRVDAARAAQVQLPEARQAVARLEEARSTAEALATCDRQVERLSADHLASRERAAELQEVLNDLRSDRIDGMIAELASRLVDDTPCPVCGAQDHPEPSEVRGRHVSREDEQAAALAAQQARDVAAAIGEQLAVAQAAQSTAQMRLQELGRLDASAALLRADRDEAAAAVLRLDQAAQQCEAAEAAVTAVDAAAGEAAREVSRLQAELQAAGERQAAASERRVALESRLRAMLGDAQSVADARRRASRRLTLIETAQTALAAIEQASVESAAAETAARQAATRAGFASPAEARAALRDPELLSAMQQQVTEAQEKKAAIEGLLADPDLAVEVEPAAPVQATAAKTRAAEAAGREAELVLAKAVQRVEQLTVLAAELDRSLRELEPVARAAQQVKELADLTAGFGANRLNMPLSAYVLAARLEEVAEAASHRLRAMTQGRYTLVHSDLSRGNARSGLRLLVSDAWTGQDRDTATLSGGETFLASLALALGLAEVVTAAAAGAPLEALFVDEGFGTLDEETLNEALEVLDGLREGGRLVGIVSHVPGLRERIPSQLRVHKGVAGSRIELRDGSDAAEPASRRVVRAAEPVPAPQGQASPSQEPERPSSRAAARPKPGGLRPAADPEPQQLALLGAD
jgi:exonuclease SbcC